MFKNNIPNEISVYKKKNIRKFVVLDMVKHLIPLTSDVEKRIGLVEIFAYYYSTHIAGKYADDYLEKLLCDIGCDIKVEGCLQEEEKTVLHVMTQAYSTGGHTRVVNDWIKFDNDRRHSIVFTDGLEGRKTLPHFLIETVKNSGGKIIFLKGTSHINKAKKLFEIASKAEKVILHAHMYDSIPVLAFSNKKWKKTIYLFNHADFRFWLGASVSDVCLEITEEAQKISKKLRGIHTTKRLDIPIDNIDFQCKEKASIKKSEILPELHDDEFVVTTMAKEYKYSPIAQYNFFDFADQLLACNNKIILVVIGPSDSNKDWKKLIHKYKRRIRVMGILNKEKVDELLLITDLYVNSFPLGGGVASLEAAAKGIKVTGMDVKGQIMDCQRIYMKKSKQELICYINDLLNGKDKYIENQLENHTKNGWCKRLEEIYAMEPIHKMHLFSPRMRFGLFEAIVQRGYNSENLEIPETLGAWKCLFEIVEMI